MTNPTEALEYYKDKAGMKFDGEKVRLDLLPITPLIGIGKVLTYGAKKYAERNWEKGLKWSRCYAAALRHLFAWWSGETNDPETGLNHLDHALCEIMFLREFAETHQELDDRPTIVNKPDDELTMGELYAKYYHDCWEGLSCLALDLEPIFPYMSTHRCDVLSCRECEKMLLKEFRQRYTAYDDEA